MKKRVHLSTYSLITTLGTIIFITAMSWIVYRNGEEVLAFIWMGLLCAICLTALFYTPLEVQLKNEELTVFCPFKFKSFKTRDIESVKLCPPTMGVRRIIGSGGFMGYWGWFRENDLGKYFAYHGKASDCFLITLKNGRKYMLGCKDAPEMVKAIQSQAGA